MGHVKEPLSLTEMTSSLYNTFPERSLLRALIPSRSWGVKAQNTAFDERMTWAVGVFKGSDDDCSGSADDGNAFSVTGRVTWLPMYKDKGKKLLHLGAAYSYRRPHADVRYRHRPEANFTDFFTNTDFFAADSIQLAGVEAAWVNGPLSLQGEYLVSFVDSPGNDDYAPFNTCLSSAYVQASYFLTGEHRRYNRWAGTFGQVLPKRDFLKKGGWGAWEAGGRYSFLDLDEGSVGGDARTLNNFTIGLNWYLNQHVRISWNYIRSFVEGSHAKGDADIFLMRFQIAF